MAEDRLCKGKRINFGGMNESKMNGMWAFSSRWCKHLPASTWHFINPSQSLHPIPALSLHPPTPSSKRSHLFNVPLFRATACILQISGEIFLTLCDEAAIKGNRTSATEARTVMKRKKIGYRVKKCEWWWERRWEDDDCGMKERSYVSVLPLMSTQ